MFGSRPFQMCRLQMFVNYTYKYVYIVFGLSKERQQKQYLHY